jgi:hypothetical protein
MGAEVKTLGLRGVSLVMQGVWEWRVHTEELAYFSRLIALETFGRGRIECFENISEGDAP